MKAASKAALFHLLGSVLVAVLAAALVFLIWYPYPYGQLSGGLRLFLMVVGVDVVCGPQLTLVLFNPKKPRRELVTDMGLVVLIQVAALTYGLHTAYQARPLFLVHEVDRFRVVTATDYDDADVSGAMARLDASLQPDWLKGPVVVGVREPRNSAERNGVLLEAVVGGRDYAQRPEFYVPYDAAYRAKALARARPLAGFVSQHPETASDAQAILAKAGAAMDAALFLPVLHKQEWVVVLEKSSARILGFLPGDGFIVP